MKKNIPIIIFIIVGALIATFGLSDGLSIFEQKLEYEMFKSPKKTVHQFIPVTIESISTKGGFSTTFLLKVKEIPELEFRTKKINFPSFSVGNTVLLEYTKIGEDNCILFIKSEDKQYNARPDINEDIELKQIKTSKLSVYCVLVPEDLLAKNDNKTQ